MDKKSIIRLLIAALMLAVFSAATLYAQDIAVYPQLGGIGNPYELAYSPDGKYVIAVSNGNNLILWEAANGREVRTFSGHSQQIVFVYFSPDGKRIFSGAMQYSNTSNEGAHKIWDVATGRVIKSFLLPWGNSYGKDERNLVAFSPDGRYFALILGDDTKNLNTKNIRLFDATTGREIRTFSEQYNYVTSIAFSPDGKQILSYSYPLSIAKTMKTTRTHSDGRTEEFFTYTLSDGTTTTNKDNISSHLRLWDVATGREIRTIPQSTRSVSFSPDGKQFLCYLKDIVLWDTATGREIKTFSGHTTNVNTVSFSSDGKQLASGSDDGIVKLWDIATGREIRTFSESGHISSVSFSPDGKRIFFGRSSRGSLWDTSSGKGINDSFNASVDDFSKLLPKNMAFSPDGKYILSCFYSGGYVGDSLKLLDAVTGQEIRTFSGYSANPSSVTFSPDGKQLLVSYGATSQSWEAETGKMIRSIAQPTLAYSPDGKYILSAIIYQSKSIKLLDAATGQEIRTFSGPTTRVNCVCFSPDGKYVLAGSGYHEGEYGNDSIVRLWDTATGRLIRTFLGHKNGVNTAVFSLNGKQIVSGDQDGIVKLWDTDTGREIKTFSGNSASDNPYNKSHTYPVAKVVFSPDGKQILSAAYLDIKLWDVATGREIRTISGINYAAFSPDGKQYLSGSHDNTFKLWDTQSGRELRTFSGHSGVVGFSPDGKRIISRSNGTVKLWDTSTGKEIAQFVSFSGTDSQLSTATRGLTVETQTAATTNEGEWLSITPDGYYQASPRGDRYLNVRVNNTVSGIDSYRSTFYNPDVVQARLQGRPDPASKANVTIQQAASFTPPQVTIQSPANYSTTNTATTNLSVAVVDQNQPLKNIKILVNGRLVGPNELSGVKGSNLQPQKASLTVTGNQRTVNFTLTLNLDPGRNIIEVIAFNGYSESPRIPVEVTWNAPAGQRPSLPNLWILAVGVNNYNDSTINNLNFCVADAKGVISSLKAQEGRRYAKVNSLLIADGEALAPTADNIRKNLNFLDQAGERDVVLLFLAGHGVSNNAGKFLFLPNDTRMNADKTVVEASAISDGDIVKVLDRAGNLLVFIDACQSGGVDNDRLVRSLMDTNAFVFTSSRGTELSQERKDLGHGVFTYSVMEGLKGAVAAQAQGNVTVLSLSGFVSQDVPRRTNGAQNPKAYSLGFYDFPMAVVK